MNLVYGLAVLLPPEVDCQLEPTTEEPEITVSSWKLEDRDIADNVTWYHHWQNQEDGHIWLSAGRRAGGRYVLRFVGEEVDFAVSPDGAEISFQCLAGFAPENVRHLLLTQVLPFVLNLRGIESLHASAVVTPAGAIAFVGDSGYGKSTIAAGLIRSGCRLLSDDAVPLYVRDGEVWTSHGSRDMGLWPRARQLLSLPRDTERFTDKKRVALPKDLCRVGDFPLSVIYFLNPREEGTPAEVKFLTQKECLIELLKAAYRLDLTDSQMLCRQFSTLSYVAQRVPARRLVYEAGVLDPIGLRTVIEEDLRPLLKVASFRV